MDLTRYVEMIIVIAVGTIVILRKTRDKIVFLVPALIYLVSILIFDISLITHLGINGSINPAGWNLASRLIRWMGIGVVLGYAIQEGE